MTLPSKAIELIEEKAKAFSIYFSTSDQKNFQFVDYAETREDGIQSMRAYIWNVLDKIMMFDVFIYLVEGNGLVDGTVIWKLKITSTTHS